jgi:hypothetical protein
LKFFAEGENLLIEGPLIGPRGERRGVMHLAHITSALPESKTSCIGGMIAKKAIMAMESIQERSTGIL